VGGGLTLEKAKDATALFLWLVSESGMGMSADLQSAVPKLKGEYKPRKERDSKRKDAKQENESQEGQLGNDTPKGTTLGIRLPPKHYGTATVNANINMTLDKDTDIEVWKMIARLLGLDSEDEPQSP